MKVFGNILEALIAPLLVILLAIVMHFSLPLVGFSLSEKQLFFYAFTLFWVLALWGRRKWAFLSLTLIGPFLII